jgi:hypothetical protein
MKYLLDTNTCIRYINGRFEAVDDDYSTYRYFRASGSAFIHITHPSN